MPFKRPTRLILKDRVSADIERHSDQKATRRGDVYFPLAQAISGVAHGLHGHLQYNADQLFDDTADDENLLRRAAELGIYQIPAFRASGTFTATGEDGATINEGELLQLESVLYRVTSAATINSGSAAVNVSAVEVGVSGNAGAGTTLRFLQPVLDIDSDVTVIEISGGAEVEPIDRVKERLAERRTSPPMGGNDNDYMAWAKAAHVDVTRAWCYSNELGLGTVVVRFVTDGLDTPIPTQTHVDAVKAHTDTVRPTGMKRFEAYAVVAKPLDITFTRLSPNTESVRAAVTAELKDLLMREAEPGKTLTLRKINEAISLAIGEDDHRISLSDDVTSQVGEFLTLGEISWPEA